MAEFILATEQFTVLNGFECADFTPDCVQGFDALFRGGSSDATVLKKPFYGFQFHPEVDDRDLIARITPYCDRY
ncbi:MAG: hypothetical protein P3X23_009425 [Thermosynechococcus sp. Uc]|uniref:hypothetical protein n=1 Tax=Thermosynechococcus sp. Uc TaxID=3034853 RepID=UPI00259F30C3|nr:hypothetical protein [Thermosynechococcus sp. Uc]MDM7327317.1 hypothetical protein [Thermosynechococcus sp. Uc]